MATSNSRSALPYPLIRIVSCPFTTATDAPAIFPDAIGLFTIESIRAISAARSGEAEAVVPPPLEGAEPAQAARNRADTVRRNGRDTAGSDNWGPEVYTMSVGRMVGWSVWLFVTYPPDRPTSPITAIARASQSAIMFPSGSAWAMIPKSCWVGSAMS